MPRFAVAAVGLLLPAALLLSGCENRAPVAAQVWPEVPGVFPSQPAADYRPRRVFAHAAFPRFDRQTGAFTGPRRVWVKGDPGYRTARLTGGPTVHLEPPFYTAVVELEGADEHGGTAATETIEVVFEPSEGAAAEALRATVRSPHAAALNEPRASFSVLAYGCFDPFAIDGRQPVVDPGDGTGTPTMKESPYPRQWAIRAMLQHTAAGALHDLPTPSMIFGAGDQVYVEPAHDDYQRLGADHPLSAWTVEAKPRPRYGLQAFERFVDRAYRAVWSFDTLDAVLRQLPAVMMWDDHEIRDGWGSQGDKHVYRDTFYAKARAGYIAHQQQRGVDPTAADTGDAVTDAVTDADEGPMRSLHQTFRLHGLPVFAMDQRSARDVSVPQVLGERQAAAFRTWIDGLRPTTSPYYLVISPLPLLYRITGASDILATYGAEITDDLLDAWSSPPNTPELDGIMAAMLRARDRGMCGIVISGDLHTSALLRGRARRRDAGDDGADDVFAYEVIASGLASVVDGTSWKHWLAREGSIVGSTVPIGEHDVAFDLGVSEPNPNFAGLTFASGRAYADLFQALPEGILRRRIELVFGDPHDDFAEAIGRGVEQLGPWPFGR